MFTYSYPYKEFNHFTDKISFQNNKKKNAVLIGEKISNYILYILHGAKIINAWHGQEIR